MTAPKPAPSKPLTFTPPHFTKDNEGVLKQSGAKPNIAIIDEGQPTEEISVPEGEEGQKAIFDFEKKPKSEVKKPFVLDRHLTQRPFHDDRLMQLKNRLQRPSFKNR